MTQAARAHSTLVIDRDAATLGDQRLLAHLDADEPRENALLVCESFLEQLRLGGCRCRSLTQADHERIPFCEQAPPPLDGRVWAAPVDGVGNEYRLSAVSRGPLLAELRWRRHAPCQQARPQIVSLRDVVAALESYEPMRCHTVSAVQRCRGDARLSVAVLRAELSRVQLSPIVLNRGLREAALACMKHEDLSLSEIAARCGRLKRASGGAQTGETSWLARRLGLLPEGGKAEPTPWIHSDVLGLIARRGLGVAPREVEL